MACSLVTNFEVALMKKLWQCSVLSRNLRVAVPSPPLPSPWGRGRVRLHVGFLGIPAISQLVCHAFPSITFAFSGYSRSVEPRNYRIDRRETGTQIGQIGKAKNCIGYQIRKPLVFFAKTENQMLKNGKSANRNEHQNWKTEVFWCKNRITDLKNSQTQNPNAPLHH